MNGDVVFFDFSKAEPANHVGIVVWKPRTGWRHRWARRNGKFKTVEGNSK